MEIRYELNMMTKGKPVQSFDTLNEAIKATNGSKTAQIRQVKGRKPFATIGRKELNPYHYSKTVATATVTEEITG